MRDRPDDGESTTVSKNQNKRRSNTSNSNSMGKLNVHWAANLNDPEMFYIPHLDDMTDEDIHATWYNEKEYKAIKHSFEPILGALDQGETLDPLDPEFCPRGLEYRTQTGAWTRYEHKRDAYDAVLDEQERQWDLNPPNDDPELIRKAYLKMSSVCANAAVMRALQDKSDIRDYMADVVIGKLPKKKKLLKSSTKKSSSAAASKKNSGSSVETEKKATRKKVVDGVPHEEKKKKKKGQISLNADDEETKKKLKKKRTVAT